MTSDQFQRLKAGDVIRHTDTGEAYVVSGPCGNLLVATRTIAVGYPAKWDLVDHWELGRRRGDDVVDEGPSSRTALDVPADCAHFGEISGCICGQCGQRVVWPPPPPNPMDSTWPNLPSPRPALPPVLWLTIGKDNFDGIEYPDDISDVEPPKKSGTKDNGTMPDTWRVVKVERASEWFGFDSVTRSLFREHADRKGLNITQILSRMPR